MGKFYYGSSGRFAEFDDWVLAHVSLAIVTKLRREEKFTFVWSDSGAQTSVWLHPAIELQFDFDTAERQTLNRAWLEALKDSANSGELRIVEEPKSGEPLPATSARSRR